MRQYPVLTRDGQGRDLLRALGNDAPRLVRVRELCIAPATSPENEEYSVLRLTAEFSDGRYRALHFYLDDLLYRMVTGGPDGDVTEEFTRYLGGEVLRANPTAVRETALDVVGEVLAPVTDAMGAEVGKLRHELALAAAKIKRLEEGRT